MSVIVAICATGFLLVCVFAIADSRGNARTVAALWQHIAELEGDKRALTESLCRAEGRPFVPVTPAERIESEGWFDGKPEVVENPKLS